MCQESAFISLNAYQLLSRRSPLLGDVSVNSHPPLSYVSFSKTQMQSLTECLLPATRRYVFPLYPSRTKRRRFKNTVYSLMQPQRGFAETWSAAPPGLLLRDSDLSPSLPAN